MSCRIIRTISSATFAIALCAGSQAFAADPGTDAMQEAYAPYRVALFKTNGKSQAEAQQAATQAQRAWNQLMEQFGAKPPAPYDRDPAFAKSLTEVARIYTKASDEIGANQLTAAHETLEKARDIMADMRRRNQVIVYSDHMNAYHAEMERLLIDGSQALSQPNGMLQVTAMVGALNYLATKLSTEAPASLRQDEEFRSLLKAVNKSVSDLQTALFAQDPVAVKDAMRKIKSPYSKLFLNFG
ncbi:MAG: hypothetical protein Q7T10_10510 [Rhodoferax sp.]|uniref:hypothetical protein n=1 Tax=Rhodoferax sp. TaxID=50421 RepID=UPI00271E0F50|nr:hypothetical protein [Rhodoferax sp.]MDO8449222.1 hypothetical protein [Rhodoferax sp.]